MDPDAEKEFEWFQISYAQMLKSTCIMVAFTACSNYKTDTKASVNNIQHSLPDKVVKTKIRPKICNPKKKTIFLTFDDGPNKGTKKMMQIVQAEEIPVTLFIIGEQVNASRYQTQVFDSLMRSKYFEIANHSYFHAFENKYNLYYSLPDSVVNDFVRCADSLHLTTQIIRTPGRNIWRTAGINSTDLKASKAAADSLAKKGFTEIGWDLEWTYDKNLKLKSNADEMIDKIDSMFLTGKTKTLNELVLLAHDQVFADANDSAELHQFIKKLKQKNEYNFDSVSNYPNLKN